LAKKPIRLMAKTAPDPAIANAAPFKTGADVLEWEAQ
jgi:hypothetical protein